MNSEDERHVKIHKKENKLITGKKIFFIYNKHTPVF